MESLEEKSFQSDPASSTLSDEEVANKIADIIGEYSDELDKSCMELIEKEATNKDRNWDYILNKFRTDSGYPLLVYAVYRHKYDTIAMALLSIQVEWSLCVYPCANVAAGLLLVECTPKLF